MNSKEDRDKYGLLQLVVLPVLDTSAFTNADTKVQVEVSSWLKNAASRECTVLKMYNDPLVSDWIKGLEADKPPSKQNAADAAFEGKSTLKLSLTNG